MSKIIELVMDYSGAATGPVKEAFAHAFYEKVEVLVEGGDLSSFLAIVQGVWKNAEQWLRELRPIHYNAFFALLGGAIANLPYVKKNYAKEAESLRKLLLAAGVGFGKAMQTATDPDKKLSEEEIERIGNEVLGRPSSKDKAKPEASDESTAVAELASKVPENFLVGLVEGEFVKHYVALLLVAEEATTTEAAIVEDMKETPEKDDPEDAPTEEHLLLNGAVAAFKGVSDDPSQQKSDQSTWPIMNGVVGSAQSFIGWAWATISWVVFSPVAFGKQVMSASEEVWSIFADFFDIFSAGKFEVEDSLDGKGNRLKEALVTWPEDNPKGLFAILKPNQDIDEILKNPMSSENGSREAITILVNLHNASYAARVWDWLDFMVHVPTLKRVMKKRMGVVALLGVIAAVLGAGVGFVWLLLTSPSTIWDAVSGLLAPVKMAGRSMIAALLIGVTLVMGYYSFLNLLYGWGVIGSVSYVSLWSFLSGGGPVDAAGKVVKLSMHVWPQVVGFCLAFVSRLTIGQVDGFLPGSEESPTSEAYRAVNEDGSVITTLQRAEMSSEARESLEAEEEKNLKRRKEMFTGAKLRRTATTLMMIICILQLIASGTWILVYLGAPEALVTGFSWGCSMIVVFIGVIVETMARFPAMHTFLEKKGMMNKGIDGLNNVLRFGGKAVVAFFVFAVLISGLNVTWIGFQNTSGGKLVVNTIDYEVKRQTERLEAKEGKLVKVTKSRKSASPSTSKKGDLPSMCKKPENVVKFRICRE